MQAMILAAGLGTRLQGETSDKPKALVQVGGKPLLQHAIEKLSAAGVCQIVINVHHFASQVVAFLNGKKWDVPIFVSDESEQLLETGGGLKKAAPFFKSDKPILIYNVDIISDIDLGRLKYDHISSGAIASLVVRKRQTQRYFKFDSDKNLTGWLNKKTGETKISRPDSFEAAKEMAFSGIHIVQPGILNFMPDEDRFSIVKVYLELAKTQNVKGFYDNSELWIDVGKPSQLKEARKLF